MIYIGPGFLAAVWYGSSRTPSLTLQLSRQQLVSFSVFLWPVTVSRRSSLLTGEEVQGGDGWRAKSYERESLTFDKSFSTLCSNQHLSRPFVSVSWYTHRAKFWRIALSFISSLCKNCILVGEVVQWSVKKMLYFGISLTSPILS